MNTPPYLSSSSSTDSTDCSSSSRKIRFAPLPRPPSQSDLLSLDYTDDQDGTTSTASTPIPPSPSPPPLDLPPPPLLPPRQPVQQPKKPWFLKPFLKSRVQDAQDPSDSQSLRSSPLSRWSSAIKHSPLVLTRTQSTTTPSIAPTLTPRRPASAHGPTSKRKGTRMLNGRIYGAPRSRNAPSDPNANPFANARDEADPVFVEWGYGGMGSVHAHGGHGVWKRLQSDAAALGDASSPDPSDPLGLEGSSGMGWVRKRREAKEKRDRELRDATSVQEPVADSDPTPTPIPTSAPPPTPTPTSAPTSPSSYAPPSPRHNLQAVSVPAPVHRHTSHSRSNSSQPTDVPQPTKPPTVLDLSDFRRTVTKQHTSKARLDRYEPSSGSESDDDDDDQDERENVRKDLLAKCAGVEKVSRHQDE